MKRVQYHRYGGAGELRLEEVTRPDRGLGQIRVQVMAAAANPMDWKIRRGEMKMLSGSRLPRGLGHDFAGVVDAVGAGVARFKAGDAVFGATTIRQAGAFAEYVVADENNVMTKPPSVPFEQATAALLVSITAWNALAAKAKLSEGQSVLMIGCLGGVGRAAVQIARLRGADVRAVAARRAAMKRSRRGSAKSLTVISTSTSIAAVSMSSSIPQVRCRSANAARC